VKITRLGHALLTSPDVPRLEAYYHDVLGFVTSERDGDGTVYMRNAVDHHTVVLKPGDEPGIRHTAYQVSREQSLDEIAKEIEGHGIAVERRSDVQPGIPEELSFLSSDGYEIRLYQEIELVGGGIPLHGIGPHKLGHIALFVEDVPKTVEFYEGVLGFRWSDWLEDWFVFLRSGRDHHLANFLRSPTRRGLHHIAYELDDFDHVKRALDHLKRNNIPLVWGPGRHGMGHNIFTYHRDPDGNTIELFTELDVMADEELGYFEPRPWHEDFPQYPKVWPRTPAAPNGWGIMPPEDFER
jgi:catechol-2,3-dioxygenase